MTMTKETVMFGETHI